ncbi:hypothetical protein ACLKA7_008403 [Drosophila subpalustris]
MTLRCRTCGSVICGGTSINLFELENLVILTDIQTVVGTTLECDPELPVHICGRCLIDLKRAVMYMKVFRERCIRTQKILRKTTINNNGFQTIDKVGNVADLDEDLIHFQEEIENVQDITGNTLDDSDQDVDSMIASVQNEMNSSDSQESAEEIEKISSPNDNHSSLSYSTGPAIEPEKTNGNESEKKKTSITSPDDDVDENDQNNSSDVKVKRRYQSWKNLTEEQVIERKREKRRRDCICEQCGKHFTDPSNFKLHMIRHSGIRNSQCTQCPKRFFTDSLLRLHVRIDHQGERPYACKHCGKTFSHTTARVIHERRHTNKLFLHHMRQEISTE